MLEKTRSPRGLNGWHDVGENLLFRKVGLKGMPTSVDAPRRGPESRQSIHLCRASSLQSFEITLTPIEEIYVPNQLLKTTIINDIVRQKPR
jgi:hypothetical protein